MNSGENARRNLESILPELKLRWAEWKSRFQGGRGESDRKWVESSLGGLFGKGVQ